MPIRHYNVHIFNALAEKSEKKGCFIDIPTFISISSAIIFISKGLLDLLLCKFKFESSYIEKNWGF